jgi:iron complex transport system ATP-binding protein
MKSLLHAEGIALAGRLSPTGLDCATGEMLAIIGPNGAGKTSLLRALAGIEIDEGFVTISEEQVASAPPARRMRLLSFMPATRSMIWPIAARDLIGLGLPSPDAARIEVLLDALELREFASRPVSSLSTGERCRVLLARALAARPKVLLLDEPMSNLDPYWVLKTLQVLRDETRSGECAVIASLHDLNQLLAFDRVLLIDRGQVIADGSPEEVMAMPALNEAFRIEKAGAGWQIAAGR